MPRRYHLVPIAIGAALSIALAACGGGGNSSSQSSVVPSSTKTARAADAKGTLTLKFPAHMGHVRTGSTTSGTKRKPAYINPNGTSLVITAFGQTVVDPNNGNASYFSLGIQDPTTGISTVNIPLYSGNYNTGDLTITEYDGSGSGNVLAYGSNQSYTDAGGNYQDGTFTLSPGGSASPVVTMVMNAAGIALTTDPVAGSDAMALSTSSYNSVCSDNFTGSTFYAFAIDASGSFVLPGQTPGAGLTGADPNSPYPGVNAATLASQSSSGASFVTTVLGPSVMTINGSGTVYAEFQTLNPLSQISNPYYPNSWTYGYVNIGPGNC